MNTVKKYWKIALIFIMFIAMAVTAINLRKANNQIQLKNVEIASLNDSVLTYVTKTGQLISKVQAVEVNRSNLKEALEISGFDLKEAKNENVKLKKVIFALRGQIESVGTVETIIRDTFRVEKTDTIRFSKLHNYNDEHISIFNGYIESQNLRFDYRYRIGFDFKLEERRKESIVTLKLDDKNARLTTANSIIVPHKTPWYKKWWLWTAVGLTGGILIAK